MTPAYVALGGNVGDVLATFRAALRELQPRRVSSAYRTRALLPLEGESAPDYWNAVCELETELAPEALLAQLHAIERVHGRERRTRWAPRPLDLDLLLYGSVTQKSATLELPHPRMHERPFVLVPLVELAPDVRIGDRTARELLAALEEPRAGIYEVRTI